MSRPEAPAPRLLCCGPAVVLAALFISSAITSAADWPMWRNDSMRRASSDEELPEALHLQWILKLPTPRPAWPAQQEKLQYDRLYEPVLLGKTLFVPSMLRDMVTAYDTDSAAEKWAFYAEGPVRFAPVAWQDKVYFVSDDGCLYCLEAETGNLLWKFRGGPSPHRLLGQDRLIGMWPARGAPVIYDGKVYFGAGLWPFMGTFIYALDAKTGAVVWANTGTGSTFTQQQHDSPAFAGVAPQGYLAATEEVLLVAGGRTVPAVFDRRTGKLIHFDPSSRAMGIKGGGGYDVAVGKDFFLNRSHLYRLGDGHFVTAADATVLTQDAMLGTEGGDIRCYLPGWKEEETVDRHGKKAAKLTVKTAYKTGLQEKVSRVFIRSGSRIYAKGEDGRILAIELPQKEEKCRIVWSTQIIDEPLNMLSGDGKLFVSTDRGRIYCFGGKPTGSQVEKSELTNLVPRGSVWKYHAEASDPGNNWSLPAYDDGAWPSGPSQLGYGDGDEATKLGFGEDPDHKPMTCYFRRRFEASGDFERMVLRLLVDDGAVVYLNGIETARIFMPSGPVTRVTPAARVVEADRFYELHLPSLHLKPGANVLAVEVHQASPKSSDLSFDMELAALRAPPERLPELPRDAWTDLADEIRRETKVEGGYCLVLGLGTGRLAEELAVRSDLHVIVLVADPLKATDSRRRLDGLGIYGTRIAVIEGSLADLELPPYMADLVVAEDASQAGIGKASVFVEKAFHVLRPHTGVLCLATSEEEHAALEKAAAACHLDQGKLERSGKFTLLRRLRAPMGAGVWTHQYADAANTVASKETLVQAPMGLLWFGGPSNEGVLPRHGHGPTPQVIDGRLFIEGRDMIRAIDIYTGRLLWERTLRDVGAFYDYLTHEPGANAMGSNYVSLEDGIYVACGRRCLRLEPATGATIAEYALPPVPGSSEPLEWGYLSAWQEFLIAGAKPSSFVATDYTAAELKDIKGEPLQKLVDAVESWKDFQPTPKDSSGRHAYILANFNKLMADAEMLSRIPAEVREQAKAPAPVQAQAKALEAKLRELRTAGEATGLEARSIQRQLLSVYYGLPAFERRPPGRSDSLLRIGSEKLLGLERTTGKILWEFDAGNQIRHNAIAVGGGRVYLIDRLPGEQLSFYKRRGLRAEDDARLVALDVRTGQVCWSASSGIFGTWLGYSEEYDVLLEAGSSARDRLADEAGKGMTAYRGATGGVLWSNQETYAGPCLLIGKRVITQVHDKDNMGFALDLLTGKRIARPHPITGEAIPWEYSRNYGCNTALGSAYMLTFRSAAAGYYDLKGDGGTGNFGGFRSGCTSNLIPAGGVLCAPDYTRTCTCAYQNQVSLALVHMPEAEMWTFQKLKASGLPTSRLGLNFGAPGDRFGPDGTLWLDYPSVGGPGPEVKVEKFLEKPEYVRHHASRMEGGDLRWVAASGVKGSGEIAIVLVPPQEKGKEGPAGGGGERHYTVSLVFAEIEGCPAGRRTFDVSVQGQTRLQEFDIAREAGGAYRTVIREFKDVPVAGALKISLAQRGELPPLLCGIQIVEGGRGS